MQGTITKRTATRSTGKSESDVGQKRLRKHEKVFLLVIVLAVVLRAIALTLWG
jgi:cell division protein FtsL